MYFLVFVDHQKVLRINWRRYETLCKGCRQDTFINLINAAAGADSFRELGHLCGSVHVQF